jgi:hypothetical protein
MKLKIFEKPLKKIEENVDRTSPEGLYFQDISVGVAASYCRYGQWSV